MKLQLPTFASPLTACGLLTLVTGCTSMSQPAVQAPDNQGYGYGGGAAVTRQAGGWNNSGSQSGWGGQSPAPTGAAQSNNGWGGPQSNPNNGWGGNQANANTGWGAANSGAPGTNPGAPVSDWPSGGQPHPSLRQLRPDSSSQWTPGMQSGTSTEAQRAAWGQAPPQMNTANTMDPNSGWARGADSLNAGGDLASPFDSPPMPNGMGAPQAGTVSQLDPNRRVLNGGTNTTTQLFDELQQVRTERDQLMAEVQSLSQALLEAQNQLLSTQTNANQGDQRSQALEAQVMQMQQQLSQAQSDKEQLAEHLLQAQIGRLQAERTLLEDRIGEGGFSELDLQPGIPQAGSNTQPSAQVPAGSAPTGQLPSGQLPNGLVPSGSVPSGQLPSGQLPSGQLPSGSTAPMNGSGAGAGLPNSGTAGFGATGGTPSAFPNSPTPGSFPRAGAGFGSAGRAGAGGQIPPPMNALGGGN